MNKIPKEIDYILIAEGIYEFFPAPHKDFIEKKVENESKKRIIPWAELLPSPKYVDDFINNALKGK